MKLKDYLPKIELKYKNEYDGLTLFILFGCIILIFILSYLLNLNALYVILLLMVGDLFLKSLRKVLD